MEYRCKYALKIDYGKAILKLSEAVKRVFTIVYDRLKTICSRLKDWFEDRGSCYQSVDTHNFTTRILLIKRIRNQ